MSERRTAHPTCREVVDQLDAWSEGQLPDSASAPFARHLDLCPPCARIASGYRAVTQAARAALAVAMPSDAKARLARVLSRRLRGGQ